MLATSSVNSGKKLIDQIEKITQLIIKKLKIIGFINIQYAIKDQKVYVLEVNPRASRTVPFISKSIGIPLANIATKIMLGSKLKSFNLDKKKNSCVFVKESVFPFDRFPGEDIILGPEMKSTGEVMGIDKKFPMAYIKSQIASGNNLPLKGSVFVSVRDEDKENIFLLSQVLKKLTLKYMPQKELQSFCQDLELKLRLLIK